ncbi:MAG: hypothetical protein OT478_13905 [Cyanobacteria bacterium FC1]|nr:MULTISPECIES: hypothetical protein [unclassified Desertifilum]MDA0211260.1 hypothetical protein [Cyanobacteria bacterium FC1]
MDTTDPCAFGATTLSLTVKIKEWDLVFVKVDRQLHRANRQYA